MGRQENLAVVWDECDEVLRKRYEEAFDAGLTCQQALEFACSSADIGQFRKIVSKGCPPKLIARIVL